MRYTRVAALIVPVLLSACSWRRTPVPIASETGSTALLVGEWAGEYSSSQTGRSGSITFDLASEKDTAFCDVVMVPKIRSMQVVGDQSNRGIVRPQPPAEPLRIRFIRLGDNRISGTLDPYVDPDCMCRVTTTFEGRLTGPDTIGGSFSTRAAGSDYVATGGRWKVTRQKARTTSP